MDHLANPYFRVYRLYDIVHPESLDRTHNVRTCSNANIAHVANASADLRSFNHVCVRLRVLAIVIVHLCELAHNCIDTRATSLILPCRAWVA